MIENPSFDSSPERDWITNNTDTLNREYAGKWIAVSGDILVASGENESDVLKKVTELGIHTIVTHRIPSAGGEPIDSISAWPVKQL